MKKQSKNHRSVKSVRAAHLCDIYAPRDMGKADLVEKAHRTWNGGRNLVAVDVDGGPIKENLTWVARVFEVQGDYRPLSLQF